MGRRYLVKGNTALIKKAGKFPLNNPAEEEIFWFA